MELSVTDAWQLTASGPFAVWPGRRAVELSPGGVKQGKTGVAVQATAFYFASGGPLFGSAVSGGPPPVPG